MRIGFDGKRATQNFTGLGNYSRFVLQALSEWHPENDYEVYAVKKPDPDNPLIGIQNLNFHYPPSSFFSSFWRRYGISKNLKRDQIDLFHGLSNEIPAGLADAGIPALVTIHDLIFLRYPQYFPLPDRKIYELKTIHAVRKAERVIAISEQTKRDLIRFLKVPEQKIDVVYQDCDPRFKNQLQASDKQRIRSMYGLPPKYLLNVGTIENRKNLMLIVKALKLLNEEIPLVVVGRDTPYSRIVKEYIRIEKLEERVIFLKNIPFSDLPGIYQMAEIFIYPSEFEGFGIPVIEAIHSGVPVIAAVGSSLEEAGGKSGIFVKPDDHAELAEQISGLLRNDEKRAEMIKSGYEHVTRFDAGEIADQLNNIYQNTINNAQRRG